MKFILIASCLFAVAYCESRVLALKGFKSNIPKVVEVEPNSKLYMSVDDKVVVLRRINVTSGGTTITLDKLVTNFADDGSKKGWPISGNQISITTDNTENVTDALNGFLFISTAAQAADPNFAVFMVTDDTTIDRTQSAISNLVFLSRKATRDANTNKNRPFHSTRISEIIQPATTKFQIYRGAPQAGYDDPNNNQTILQRVFMNPIQLTPNAVDKSEKFFTNIEPLEITTFEIWFLTATGPIQFDITSEWEDQLNYTTTAVTTTGLVSNQLWTYNSSVQFQWNPTNYRKTGYIVSCDITGSDVMNVKLSGIGGSMTSVFKSVVTADLKALDGTPVTDMQVTLSSMTSGLYYIQYFGIDEGVITTTPVPSSIASSAPAGSTITPPTDSTNTPTVPSNNVTATIETSTKSVSTTFKLSTFISTVLIASFVKL